MLHAPRVRRAPASPFAAAAAAALLLLAGAAPAASQVSPLALEVRGGLSVPVAGFREGALGGGEVGRAPTLGASLVTRNAHGWGVTLGFAQSRFDCAPGCPGDDYVATDMEVGGIRTFGAAPLVPWVRAAFAVGRTEYDAPPGETPERRITDLSLGATAGAGVAMRVGRHLGISPGVRYAWMNARATREGVLRLRYLMADVGVLLTF